jgi:hypothetical protein
VKKPLLVTVRLIVFAGLVVFSVLAQNKQRHGKPRSVPIGTGTGAISWEPEEGSAFLAYTRKLPAVTRIELDKITKQDGQITVLSSKILTSDDAEQFAKLWRRLKRGSGAGCFVPAYNLKFFANEDLLLDTEVCFGCDNLTLPDGTRTERWGFDGKGPEGQALLAALKILLSPTAQH